MILPVIVLFARILIRPCYTLDYMNVILVIATLQNLCYIKIKTNSSESRPRIGARKVELTRAHSKIKKRDYREDIYT